VPWPVGISMLSGQFNKGRAAGLVKGGVRGTQKVQQISPPVRS